MVGVFFGFVLLKYLRHNPGSAIVTKNNLQSIEEHFNTRLASQKPFTLCYFDTLYYIDLPPLHISLIQVKF